MIREKRERKRKKIVSLEFFLKQAT